MELAQLKVDPELIGQLLSQYIWPFARISALLMVMPVLGTRLISARIRILLAVLLTLVIVPSVPNTPDVDVFSVESVLILIGECLVGVCIGFMLQVLFQTLVVGGQIVAMQNGLGFSTLVDPVNGTNVASISQLYLMIANLYFFSINGHLVVIEVLGESFQVIPYGALDLALGQSWFSQMTKMGAWMFVGGLLIALPSMIAMLLVNASFGVISRLAPQFNIFAVGFPFNMILGLSIISITLTDVIPQFDRYTQETLQSIRGLLNL